ncbi:MAG: patatin-like phospholipase family protein [Acidimicrobiales bacterium]|nr:patatin-like phospholipase family protein [Acidimicrobiales bacterium]
MSADYKSRIEAWLERLSDSDHREALASDLAEDLPSGDFRSEGRINEASVLHFEAARSLEKRSRTWIGRKSKKETSKTAFVFSGGGNKGAAQVGMLKGLLKDGIVPDLIVGCSVGSLNGAAFALNPNENGVVKLEELWKSLSGEVVFPKGKFYGAWRFAEKRESVFPISGLREIIEDYVGVHSFSDLKIPLKVVAASVEKGDEVIIEDGTLVSALLASAALPGIFPSISMNGQHLIDGGVLNDAPISVAIASGMKNIYLLSCSTVEPQRHNFSRPIEAMLYAFGLSVSSRLRRELGSLPPEIEVTVIEYPGPYGLDWRDFSQSKKMIDLGEQLVVEYLSQK